MNVLANDNEAVIEAEARARVGSTLRGKWVIDRLIDRGGMASVFAATHRNGNRVAVKVLHRHISEQADLKDRFLREGYVANKVGHPGAVQVLDDDVADDGAVFLVMELLEGESLEQRMKRTKTLSVVEALFAADHVLDVLASAHDAGIIHRDIKPANVFITKDGRIKLLDFGLARVREASFKAAATKDGILMGTAAYMAPEQAQGKAANIDTRADQWAVGALLFTGLSGHFVHEARNLVDRIIAAGTRPARSLATVAPQAPADVIALVDRALAFDKSARFADCRAMRVSVQAAFHNAMVQARQHPPASGTQPHTEATPVSLDLTPSMQSVSVDLESMVLDSLYVEVDPDGGDVSKQDTRAVANPLAPMKGQNVEYVGSVPDVQVSMAHEPSPEPPKKQAVHPALRKK
jgi:serine/threonine protein kinase